MDRDCLVQAMEPGHTPWVGGWVGALTRREWMFPTAVTGGKVSPGIGELGKEDKGEQWRVQRFWGWPCPWLWAGIQPVVRADRQEQLSVLQELCSPDPTAPGKVSFGAEPISAVLCRAVGIGVVTSQGCWQTKSRLGGSGSQA